MSDLRKIGIVDETFRLATVEELITEGTLERPMDGNHGEQHPKVADYVPEGIPFIMANDISNGRINYDTCSFITKKQADGLRKGFAKPGDVLITHKATIGRTALVGEEAKPYIMLTPQVTYYRIKNPKVLDNRYLRHYFDSELFQKTLAIWATAGATRSYLGITDQRKLPIIVPPRAKQRKIAAILTAYDDLIEANKRRIALLDKMAEEIYREWFVRMRFPGSENTKFVKGVPKGWIHLPIGELTSVLARGISPRYSDESARIVINQNCIRNEEIEWRNVKTHDSSVPEEKLLRDRDILVNSTGVGTLGRSAILWNAGSDLTCDSHVTICRADSEKVAPLFLGFAVRLLGPYFDYLAVGSTGQTELNQSFISKTRILVPACDLQNRFDEVCFSKLELAHKLRKMNDVAARTRDFVLTRLISGKLSVESLDIQFPPSMREEAIEPRVANA